MRGSDALVVGGGAIGCAVAFQLAREGLSVTLLERDGLARHASGAAAGMLLPFGESEGEGPLLDWGLRSLASFPGLCAELRQRSGVDPELEVCGALHLADSPEQGRRLQERAQRPAGHGLEWLDGAAARELEAGLPERLPGALWSPREGHVRSPLLVRAFAGAAASLGARIEAGVPVTGLLCDGDRVTGVQTPQGPRAAAVVVLCAGAWTPALAPFPLPVEPVGGQILCLDPPPPGPRCIVRSGDVYLVPKRDGSLVVGATEERVGFEVRVTAGGMARLLGGASRLLPALIDASFRGGWAGLRPATPDGLPAIGTAPGWRGLLVAAGHHRNGVLLSPVTGRLVADLVLGKPLPADAAVFAPGRFDPGGAC